jgi:hypothetical protein
MSLQMKIERSDARPLSSEDLQHLETLRRTIERAAADGKISSMETEQINTVIHSNHRVMPEELALVKRMIWFKVQRGDLEVEWVQYQRCRR